MAVKQNNADDEGSSTAGGQETNSDSGQKTLDLARMIEIMELVNTKMQQGELISETDIIRIYKHIVFNLCSVPMPRQAAEMKQFKEDICKVGEFLSKVNETNAFSVYLSYIQTVCSMITGPSNPSGAVAVVFQLFPAEWIAKAVSLILSSSEHATDEAIRKTVNVLCYWLRCCGFCQNLNLWILAILNRLREQQKFMLLFDIAMDIIEPLFVALVVPVLRPKVAPVVFHVLSSVKHTPEVFHKVINRVPGVIKQLKNDSLNLDETRKILQRLVDVLSALLSHFQGNEELYKAVEATLAEFTPSYDYRSTLEYPSWTETGEISFSHTNARVGLVNLGNTCYMNSVLQALVMTKEFSRNILLSTSKSSMLFKVQQLFALMLHSKRPELTPGAVLHATRPSIFLPGFQQDSSEFLGHILEQLDEQEKSFCKSEISAATGAGSFPNESSKDMSGKAEASGSQNYQEDGASSRTFQRAAPTQTAIEKTFMGKVTTTYKCLACSGESRNTDTFRDLQLSFPELKSDCATNYSVQDLLDYYCSPEQLVDDNKYFCDNCKKLTDGQRYISFVNAPKNLILTLKHFKYDQKFHMRAKLMHKVFHDENISIKVHSPDTLTETCSVHYNLYASVVHSGVSMDSGHYYTYASDRPDAWFKFNDNLVTTCSISELHNLQPPNTPYILFYQMKSKTSEEKSCSLEASGPSQLIRVDSPDFPTLEELPPHLRDFVMKDNAAFQEELRIRKFNMTAANSRGSGSTKNNRNGGGDDNRDNDDEPPSACGGNALNYVNRFIC